MTSTAVVDHYRTRIVGDAGLIERREPTVWGTMPGPLDRKALDAHEQRGYIALPSFLSVDDVALYSGELERLASEAVFTTDERVVVEKESNEVRSIFEVHRTSRLIERLIRRPQVLDCARQLLGSEVYVHQSRVNYMPGFNGAGFYWHSDFETWHAEDGMPAPRAVSLSIALTDNYPYNGGLMLMPGSHRTFVPCVGETPVDHYHASLKEQQVGVPAQEDLAALAGVHGIDQFTGPAGSALWFDSNLMHGSGNNITPFPRSNIFVVFNSVENALAEPFAAPAQRPTFIASREFTPLRAHT